MSVPCQRDRALPCFGPASDGRPRSEVAAAAQGPCPMTATLRAEPSQDRASRIVEQVHAGRGGPGARRLAAGLRLFPKGRTSGGWGPLHRVGLSAKAVAAIVQLRSRLADGLLPRRRPPARGVCHRGRRPADCPTRLDGHDRTPGRGKCHGLSPERQRDGQLRRASEIVITFVRPIT